MPAITDSVGELLSQGERTLVFPSEVIATFWRRKALELMGRGCIRAERIISWDRFKERTFELHQQDLPSNSLTRHVFVSAFLSRNAGDEPMLRHFVSPAFAADSERYRRLLVRMLPSLRYVTEAAAGGEIDLSEDILADTTALYDSYTDFLRTNRLYEPAFADPGTLRVASSYVLMYPEVVADYVEFADLLTDSGIPSEGLPTRETPRLLQFENSRLELTWVFSNILELLSSGMDLRDIVLSVGDLDGWESHIRESAQQYGIPVTFRYGRPLASYRESRIFSLLSACGGGDFSLQSVRALLLDGLVPWKEAETAAAVVRLGIAHRCIQGRELWMERLRRFGDKKSQDFFSGLVAQTLALAEAGSFAMLRSRIHGFIARNLSLDRLPQSSLRIVQACLEVLNALAGIEESTGLSVPNPFALWLDLLSDRLYVHRGDEGGIPVYPYRVAAGICPPAHFVANVTERSAAVKMPRFPFLPDYLVSDYPDSARDLSVPFLNLYGSSGEQVLMSFSTRTFDGPALPPAQAVTDRTVQGAPGPKELLSAEIYAKEARFWAVGEPELRVLSKPQAASFQASLATSWVPRATDLTTHAVSSQEIGERLLALRTDDCGRLEISSTALDSYTGCRFAYLMDRLIRDGEDEFDLAPEEAREVGTLQHRVLYELFDSVRQLHGSFRSSDLEEYRSELPAIIDRVMERPQYRHSAFVPPVWTILREQILRQVLGILDAEAQELDGYAVVALENTYRTELTGTAIRLNGRIDRVSETGESRILIDYKKNVSVTRPSLNREDGDYPTFQLPFYLLLLEDADERPWRAAYFDVTKGKLRLVFDQSGGKAMLDEGQAQVYLEATRRAIAAMEKGVTTGDYRTPGRSEGCDSCAVRSVCRKKYVVGAAT